MNAPQPTYGDILLLIDNHWLEPRGGRWQDVRNPATGAVIGRVACADADDLGRALHAAQAGFETWRGMSAHERGAIMRRASNLLRERSEGIARQMTMEQGKPLAESRLELAAGADIIDWFADEGRRIYGRVVPGRNPLAQQLVVKEPVGPVAAFTPWNFPVNQIVRKLGAALACGCSFLCKAPEETPASPAALMRCFVDAGIPPGVIGLVFGDPAQISAHLIAHPMIRKLSFTGSTPVGKQLAALAGQHMKRVSMELGGHAPVIVAEDADLDLAVQAMSAAKFRNAGQVCISPTRFLVHRSLSGAFAEAFAQAARSLVPGDGLRDGTTLGPLANTRRVDALQDLVRDARAHGAQVLTGGERLSGAGNFFAPTVVSEVPTEAALFNAEPFGPVAGIRAFDHLDEAIAEANRLPFGLAAYAFTQSMRTVQRLTQRVEAGMLWINQAATTSAELPFGGIKESGYGSEGGPEAMEAYLNTKTVTVACV